VDIAVKSELVAVNFQNEFVDEVGQRVKKSEVPLEVIVDERR